MRKLLIMLGALALAFGVNAASVLWTVTDAYQNESTTKIKSSTPSYAFLLLYSSSTTDLGYTIAGSNSITFDSTVTKVYSGAAEGLGGTGSSGKSHESYGVGSYYYIVLYNSSGAASETAFDYYYVSSAKVGNPTAVAPDTPIGLTWQANTSTSYTAAAVPEPTSGLLLLLGVAGIALKRKRA